MQNQKDVEIKTKRLILRTPTESNEDVIKAIMQIDSETREAAIEHIRWINNGAYENRLVFNLFIWIAQTNECIGRVYLHAKPELGGEIEIGYGIFEAHRNNGYATEAAKAIIQFAFEKTEQDVLVAIVKPENIPSQHVIKKLGFTKHSVRRVEDENGVDCDFDYFQLYHNDWQRQNTITLA